jgi:hypothetical protein
MKHDEKKLLMLFQPFLFTPELVAWLNKAKTEQILKLHNSMIEFIDPAGQSSDKNPQPQEA